MEQSDKMEVMSCLVGDLCALSVLGLMNDSGKGMVRQELVYNLHFGYDIFACTVHLQKYTY